MWEILTRGSLDETCLIGSDNERSNVEVVRAILSAMGKGPDEFDYVPDCAGHDSRYSVDSSELRGELGCFPACAGFSGGIGQAISWNLQNEEWRAMSKEQVEENIFCSASSLHDEMGESIRCVVFRSL